MSTSNQSAQRHHPQGSGVLELIQNAGVLCMWILFGVVVFFANHWLTQGNTPNVVASPPAVEGSPGGGDPVVTTREVRQALRRFKSDYAPVLSKSEVGRSKRNTPRTVEDVLVEIIHRELSVGRKEANALDSDKQISAGR